MNWGRGWKPSLPILRTSGFSGDKQPVDLITLKRFYLKVRRSFRYHPNWYPWVLNVSAFRQSTRLRDHLTNKFILYQHFSYFYLSDISHNYNCTRCCDLPRCSMSCPLIFSHCLPSKQCFSYPSSLSTTKIRIIFPFHYFVFDLLFGFSGGRGSVGSVLRWRMMMDEFKFEGKDE